jgi:N-acetylneuraminate synthase
MSLEELVRPVRIGEHGVGPGHPVFLVAEVGNAHDGSCNAAHAYIDAIARTGAQAVKFQTHLADAESTAREPFRVPFSRVDATRRDYWRRMEFSPEQWAGLKAHAEERGLVFLSSPFSLEAVELLDRLGVAAFKVASGETNNTPLLERIAATRRPVLISTGMSYRREIDEAVKTCESRGAPFVLLHCTSAYPCPPEQVGLNVLAEFRERHGCPVGLSDHSGDLFAALAAAALGVDLVEVHVCLSRDDFGPDVRASLTPAELARLQEGLRAIRAMRSAAVDKDEAARALEPMRRLFCKSVVYARDLRAGAVLLEGDLVGKKPGDGIPVARWREFVGRRLLRDVRRDDAVRAEDVQ